MQPHIKIQSENRLLQELASKPDLCECVRMRKMMGIAGLKRVLFGMAKHKRLFTLALLNNRIPLYRTTQYKPEAFHARVKCPLCKCYATHSHVLIECCHIFPQFLIRVPQRPPPWNVIRKSILRSLFSGEHSTALDTIFNRWANWNTVIGGNPYGIWYSILSYPLSNLITM